MHPILCLAFPLSQSFAGRRIRTRSPSVTPHSSPIWVVLALAIFSLIGMSRWRTDDAQAQVFEPVPPDERIRRSHRYVHHARSQHRLASLTLWYRESEFAPPYKVSTMPS